MSKTFISRGRLIDPASQTDCQASVLIEDGIIKKISEQDSAPPSGAQVIDASGLILAPGLVDMRVQSRNPGEAYKENPASLGRAATAGGITSIVCLPNTNPVLDDAETLRSLTRLTDSQKIKIYAYGAATQKIENTAMAELGLLAEAGAVGFTNGTQPISSTLVMRRVMSYASMLGKPVVQHAEDPELAAGGEMNEGEQSTRLGLKGITAAAEEIMISRDLTLARLTGARYHVAHISTARGLALVRAAKDEGLFVTCDTAPPYFILNDLAVSDYDTRFQLSPPLRSEDDRLAVVSGITDGTIDAIASDHSPQDRDSKLMPFGVAKHGYSGLETLLATTLSLYHAGHISLGAALSMITHKPADILGIDGGMIAEGRAADFILIDPDRGWQVRGNNFLSLSSATPFEGHPVQGQVIGTWIDGVQVFDGRNE